MKGNGGRATEGKVDGKKDEIRGIWKEVNEKKGKKKKDGRRLEGGRRKKNGRWKKWIKGRKGGSKNKS